MNMKQPIKCMECGDKLLTSEIELGICNMCLEESDDLLGGFEDEVGDEDYEEY